MKQELKANFSIQDLFPVGMLFVVAGIAVAFGMSIIGDTKDDFCTYGASTSGNQCLNSTGGTEGAHVESEAFNASLAATTGIAKIPAKMPILATIVIAAIIIGVLVSYLYMRTKG